MFRKRTPTKKRSFLAPEGKRLYAIGDIHGCADLLEDLLKEIVRDDAERSSDSTIIFLGDPGRPGP